MDFRGTYTPLHAFREAYAKAKAIGVSLSDSSESDSSDDLHMPSPLSGARRSLNLGLVTEQRLEKMDTTQDVQIMTAGGSPRGELSPRPPSSTARRPSVSRVTAFTPKTLKAMSPAAGGRLSGSADQHPAAPPVPRTLGSESPHPSQGRAATEGSNTSSGKQAAANIRGTHLLEKERLAGHVQAEVVTNQTSTSELDSSQHVIQRKLIQKVGMDNMIVPLDGMQSTVDVIPQGGSKQQLKSSVAGMPPPRRLAGADMSQSAATLQKESVLSRASPEPSRSRSGVSPKPTRSPSGLSPKPSRSPSGVSPEPSGGVSAEPQDWSTLLGQEAVKSPSARVDNCATAVAMSASHSASFRPAAAVPFKPATASFKPAVAPSMQTKAAAVGPNRPVPAPSKPTVVGPSEQQSRANWAVTPAQVPLQQAQSGSKPLPSPVRPALPFKPALVPSQHETRPVLRPASVPFSPATVASQQTEVPSSSTALPLQPTAVPSLPATSSFAPVPFKTAKVPFRPAAVPFKAATLPVEPARVAAMGPSKTARSGVPSSSKAGLPIASPTPTASLPIASPPPKAGLPIASPSRKAGLPAASPTPKANLPIASLAPKAADAIITPAPSRAPVAAGLLSSPDSFAQPASQPSVMSEQQQPDAHTLTGPSTTAVAADTVALQTHDTTDQRCSRQADITQAVAGSVSNIAAVVDSSQKVSAHSANRKFPRARNQIVRAVKACAQAVSEPIAEGLGVSAHAQGLFKLVAEGQGVMDVSPGEMSAATASRRFPRARNMVVNAVKARALSLQASQGVRLGQTLAAASAAAGSSHVSKAASSPVPRLDLTQVGSGSNPTTPTPAAGLVTPPARSAVGPKSMPTPTPPPTRTPTRTPIPTLTHVANPSAGPPSAARTVTPGTTPPASTPTTPLFSTPPPQRTNPQGSLASEHRHRRSASASAQKPPLHSQVSPGVLLTPPAQAGSAADAAAKLSSASTPAHTPPGVPEADVAAEAAGDIPRRSPLSQRGLTKQQWAELQHRKATKPPRKALSFQYPPGYPWLPEPRPKDLATAAASDAARAAVKPAEGRAVGHASNALSTLSATSSTDSLAESASHQMQASGGAEEGQTQQGPAHGVGQDLPAASTVSVGMSGTAPGARLGSTGAVANSPYAPPSAGRGSEWGVSTSEPSSPGAEAMHPPAFLLPHKHNSAVQPMSGAQAAGGVGRPSPLVKVPGKLAGAQGVGSPRPPWEIKASTPATASPLARKYAATPGMGAGAVASRRQQSADDHDMTAALSHKSQQRRAQKVTRHKLRGERKANRSWWLTAVTLLLLCGGGSFMLAPHTAMPRSAAKLQTAVSGMASQAAGRLSPLVPSPNSNPITEAPSSSWQAHSFQAPLQVWHQLTAATMSRLRKSGSGPAPAEESVTGSENSVVWGGVTHAAKQVLEWPGLQELGGRVAGRLPGLVHMGAKPGIDEEEGSQSGHAWAQHVLLAPATWKQQLQSASYLPSNLMSGTAGWLVTGLESITHLAGLSSKQTGGESNMPEYEAAIGKPSVESESAASMGTQKETAANPVTDSAELARVPAEPFTDPAEPAVATAQPPSPSSSAQTHPTAVVTQLVTGSSMAEAPTHMPRQTPLESKDAPTKASDVPVEPTALPDESTALPAVPAPEEEAATSDEAASQHSPKPVTDATELVEAVGGVIPAENREQLAQEGEQSSTASWQPSEAAAVVDALVSTQAKDEGDLVSTQPPAASDPEAEVHIQSSEPLPLNSDPPSTSLEESTDVRGARHTSDLNSASADSQPDTADAESKPHHKLSRFGYWSHAKLQRLQSRLADKQWFTAPSLPQAPDTISSSLEQPAESEHLSLAHTDAAQRQAGESAQTADSAQTDGAESAQTDGAASGRIDEARQDPEQRQTQRAESLLPASIFPGAQFFLLGAASLLAAWSVSSLLLGRFIATSLSRPTTPEAQTLPEEGEEQQSPEAAYGDAEEGEPQTSAQGTSFVMRARSVVRSMSEAVSGLATNRSEGHEAEAGLGAESAPGGSGVGSRRGGRKPRGRRELAALGDISEIETTPRRSRHAPDRFTVDSYDGRSKDIRKYHRSETLVQNVDTLSLRNRTVLTPSPAEMTAACSSRELRSLAKRTGR